MKKNIFFTSLILTLLIFSTAMLLNYSFDFFRLDSIVNVMQEHEISSEAYLTEESFIEAFGGDKCSQLKKRIEPLKKEIKDVGSELSNYGRISFFKKGDYNYWERKYFLLELKFLSLIERVNKECMMQHMPILFFYRIDDDICERQGYMLSKISDKYGDNVVVLSIDKNYKKEPLINLLILKYNITRTPTIVIGGEIKLERLVYFDEIESIIDKLILDSDFYGSEYDFNFVLDRTGTDKGDFLGNVTGLLAENIHPFAKGDLALIKGRLTKNSSMICDAADYYESVKTSNAEEKAILYETMASLGCQRDKKGLLLNASKMWANIGNDFRAKIDYDLSQGKKPNLQFSELPLNAPSRENKPNASLITIGNSSIILTRNDILVSQADRVSRDWLSYQLTTTPFSQETLTVFSEKLTYTEEELLPSIGWHEGGRITELKSVGLSHEIATGTIVAKKEGKWYAPNDKGVFSFEVPIDKVLYPTTRFLRADIAVITDTHGINMLVEQAVRKKATVVVGCCDHQGKIKAAQYLAGKGISVVCFTDKYLPLILGSKSKILGSPPIKNDGSSIVLGGQPITISGSSTVVAQDVGDYSKVQSYYDTPARYFNQLEKMTGINVIYVEMDEMNQTKRKTVLFASEYHC